MRRGVEDARELGISVVVTRPIELHLAFLTRRCLVAGEYAAETLAHRPSHETMFGVSLDADDRQNVDRS